MQKLDLFTEQIHQFEIQHNFKNIIDELYNIKSTSDGRVVSNKLGWQSHNLYTKNIEILLEKIIPILSSTFEYYNIQKNYSITYTTCWGNINKQFSYNEPHRHPYSFLSGVIYLQHYGENHGNIYFNESSNIKQYYIANDKIKKLNLYNSNKFSITPKTGDVIIFPSWLEHGVEQNFCAEDRISISFNTKIYEHK